MACESSQPPKTDESSNQTQPGVSVNASYDASTQTYTIKSDDNNQEPPPATESTRCLITYLDEGGANFVFTLAPLQKTSPLSPLHRKLLRLPKNHAHVLPADAQLLASQDTFTTLFPPTSLIHSSLTHLDSATITALNAHLLSLPPTLRPARRATDFLPDKTHMTGLLITSMTPSAPTETLLQLKPKWLAQSPSAPLRARRCRTCALRAQRTATSTRTASDAQEICPLALIHPNLSIRRGAFGVLTADSELVEYLAGEEAQGLLRRLGEWQQEFDQCGVLGAQGEGEIGGLCKAMTLRDCTLYVRRTLVGGDGDEGAGIEARLGDLDLKLPARLEHWRSVERRLIEGGWYANEEEPGVWREEGVCTLSVNVS